jgi:hypothetical protein
MDLIHETPVAESVPFESGQGTDIDAEECQTAIIDASNSFSWNRIRNGQRLRVRVDRQMLVLNRLQIDLGGSLIIQGSVGIL